MIKILILIPNSQNKNTILTLRGKRQEDHCQLKIDLGYNIEFTARLSYRATFYLSKGWGYGSVGRAHTRLWVQFLAPKRMGLLNTVFDTGGTPGERILTRTR